MTEPKAIYQSDLFDKRRKRRNPMISAPEALEQESLFSWAALAVGRWPELRWMMHIPNGGARNPREGRALKRRGVRAGVADIFLPVMRMSWGGLWIEMKRTGGRTEKTQDAFLRDMRAAGYRAEICEGWENARDVVVDYLTAEGERNQKD